MSPTEESEQIKQGQRATWNAVSAGWDRIRDQFDAGVAPVTQRMLELAELRPGDSVLDVATGHGEPALTAARLVGPTGHVIGTDIAPDMLAIARHRAAGFSHVEFVESDLESLDFAPASFRVVLSRFGLMFAVDHVATFGSLHRFLVPGGVFVAAVWGPLREHAMSTGPLALSERLELPAPDPSAPGPFTMADPEALHRELAAAGFADVAIEEQVAPFRFDSVAAYVRYNKYALPPQMISTARARLGADDVELDATLAGAVRPLVAADGTLTLPSKALVLRGVRR